MQSRCLGIKESTMPLINRQTCGINAATAAAVAATAAAAATTAAHPVFTHCDGEFTGIIICIYNM